MMKWSLVAIVALMFCASTLFAQKARFESMSEGMVDALADERESVGSVNLKIEFDVNSDRIRPESRVVLAELCKALNHPRLMERTIVIKGHTDSDGPEEYNLRLSERRALSVRNHLAANCRIESERMKIEGCGEAFPLVPNTSPVNKQINRRVEIQAAPAPPPPSSPKKGVGFEPLGF